MTDEADLLAWLVCGLPAVLYALGTVRLWRNAGFGHGASVAQFVLGLSGFAILSIALLSPLRNEARPTRVRWESAQRVSRVRVRRMG